MKLNRKGFTLIELLAALVILGLLMAVAAPNIMGIISKNRNATYVEDAEKLVSRAEYVLRGDPKISKPTNGHCVGFTLGYLDNSEFNNPPYGGKYYANYSFVIVRRYQGEYKYYVQLIEQLKQSQSSDDRGVKLISIDTLSSDDVGAHIEVFDATALEGLSNLSAGKRVGTFNLGDGNSCSFVASPGPNDNKVYSDDALYDYAEATLSPSGA